MRKFNHSILCEWLFRKFVSHPSRQLGQLSLFEMVEESCLAWQNTLKEFHLGDQEVTDYLIYKINAAERRYMVLLKQARAQKITAWPEEQLKPVVLPVANSGGSDGED